MVIMSKAEGRIAACYNPRQRAHVKMEVSEFYFYIRTECCALASSLLVASSRMMTFGSRTRALITAMHCFSPPARWPPPSPTSERTNNTDQGYTGKHAPASGFSITTLQLIITETYLLIYLTFLTSHLSQKVNINLHKPICSS